MTPNAGPVVLYHDTPQDNQPRQDFIPDGPADCLWFDAMSRDDSRNTCTDS